MGKQAKAGLTWQLLTSIFLFQLFGNHLWGLDPHKTVTQYLVDQWDMVHGLPSNSIRSITQTPDGYLWIGTNRGLVRFEGMKFVPVPFDEKEEVSSQEITNLFVDREGGLWIGRLVGLTFYRCSTNQFKMFTGIDGITDDGIRCIKDDMKGNTWISFTVSYVNRFFDGKFFAYDASHGLLGKKINAIVEDRQGNLLFGTRENGIFTYKNGTFFKYPVPVPDNVFIITMHEDRGEDLWIGTNKGLFRAKGKKTERYAAGDGLSGDWITCITEDSERNLWVGTDQGLNRIKKKQDGAVTFENLLNPFPINCIFEDREKSLWIGTGNSGIRRLKDGKFMPYEPFEAYPEENPLSLFEDRHGDTWIGTDKGKLFRCRDGNIIDSAAIRELSGTGIAAIAEDAEGNLWLGTTGKGAFQKKNGTFVQFTTRQGLADNVVTSIYRDSRGNLWFSTFDGVNVRRYRGGLIESLKSGDGLSGKRVHNVYESKEGDIWIAADRGITILTKAFAGGPGGRFSRKEPPWSPKAILRGVSVTCIYEDPSALDEEGVVYWIATEGAGLKRLSLKNGTVTSHTTYTTAHDMASNFIYQFLEDSRGNFWLMSDSGILRVGKSELDRIANGSADKMNCTSFGISDGMKSLEFDNKFSRNSVLRAGSGEFRFITKKGISMVNPAKMGINKTPPPVVIERIGFNRRSIPLQPDAGPVTFKGISNLSFHFTALTFLSPEKTSFKYRMEGVDADQRGWISLRPGQARAAHYRDLAPGTYIFRVTACSAEGVWNPTGASVTVILEPFFYQILVFKIVVLLLFTALAGAAFYIYKKRKPLFEKKAKYKGATLDPSFVEESMTKLKYLTEIEKVYCDADITLQSLAEKMSIAPYQLSQLLNEKLDRHFADFINWHRIEEVKSILGSPGGARRKISAIAIEVGFNTMVAFYRAFKKYTDTTPTLYKKEVGEKNKY